MYTKHARTAAFCLLVCLGGCAGTQQPATPDKRPPLSLQPDTASSVLVGERMGGVLNNQVFVLSVDDVLVPNPTATATEAIRISPGDKRLVVVQQAGGFRATVPLVFVARPETSYRVRAAQDANKPWYQQQIYSAGGDTFFWVENYDTGEPVSEKIKVFVTMPNRQQTIPIAPVKIK